MVKSLILAALLSVARLSHARPTLSTVLSQLEEMRVGVEEYNRNLPEAEYQAMEKVILEANRENRESLACSKYTLVFARGTFEPGGTNNLGSLVGMPFFSQLRGAIPGIEGAGVNYSNDVFGYIIGYVGGTTPGSSIMAKQIKDKVAACPDVKIIAGGYSQGAQVTHQAIQTLSEDVKKHITAVIMFGDPMNGVAIPGISKENIYTNCAASDPICSYLPIPLGAHLTYGSDRATLQKVVTWAKSHI